MARKLVAVSDIKHNGELIKAGTEIDPASFSRDELISLRDSGAIAVEDNEDPVAAGPETEVADEEPADGPNQPAPVEGEPKTAVAQDLTKQVRDSAKANKETK